MLDKNYQPKKVEQRIYEAWEKSGAFSLASQPKGSPYCIMMPPPNVTGSLHMGHALTFTIQDILVRYHRMRGRNTLWQPGMDHAGIYRSRRNFDRVFGFKKYATIQYARCDYRHA